MATKSTSSDTPQLPIQCGVSLPNSTLVREATEFVRDTESELLFNHSSRVYCFGSLAGERKGLSFDPELLYVGAMFHDMGLTQHCRSAESRFEVDGANAAAEFLRQRGISESEVYEVWTAIALHTTPEIPHHMTAVVALVTQVSRWMYLALLIPITAPRSVLQSWQLSREQQTSKKTLSTPFMKALGKSRKQPLATSKRMF